MGSQNAGFTSALVVGGCGFLGHHIVRRLIEDLPGVKISVLDLRTEQNRFPDVDYYNGDVTSAADVSSVLEKVRPQVLFHTASPTAIRFNKTIFDKVNIAGTKNLLSCAAKSGHVKAFVFTSSSSIVHDTISDLVDADETWPVLEIPPQRSYYSWTKGVAEKAVLAANRRDGMLTMAVRPCGLIGEGDVQVMPPMLNMYLTGKHFWQLGDNRNAWDMTYVGNAAHAHVLAAKALWQTHGMSIEPLDHERVDGEAFTITNDEPLPFWSFVHKIWRVAGWKGTPHDAWVIPRTPGLIIATMVEWLVFIFTLGFREAQFKKEAVQYSTMRRTFNIDKAKNRLGYKPIVSLDEGIVRGAQWLLDQRKEKGQVPAKDEKRAEVEEELLTKEK